MNNLLAENLPGMADENILHSGEDEDDMGKYRVTANHLLYQNEKLMKLENLGLLPDVLQPFQKMVQRASRPSRTVVGHRRPPAVVSDALRPP